MESAQKANNCQTTNRKAHYAVSTNSGFQLRDTLSNSLKLACDSIEGGLRLCQNYKRSSLFFVVGTGTNPGNPSNRLCLWNHAEARMEAEVKFLKPILELRVEQDWVVVADETTVSVFDFE